MANNLMSVTAPPPVYGYAELQLAKESLKDSIIAAVDMENIDHTGRRIQDPLDKLSEVGIATLDMRNLPGSFEEMSFAEIARFIEARHYITDNWSWVTPKTCPAYWHINTGKPHVADPYHCRYATSRRTPTGKSAMEQIINFVAIRSNASHLAQSKRRHAMVMFWDAHLERTTFNATENKNFDKPDTTFLDLQKWDLIRRRYKDQPSCSTLLHSLGIEVPNLHNACNDAVAEVLAFIRILKFTEEEYNAWTGKQNLPTIRTNIQDTKAYRANRKMEKQMEERQEARRRNRNKNKGKNNGKNNGNGPVPG
ncbi:hypothetical protein V8F33_006668 [Rhypophila sp. PSN 637]